MELARTIWCKWGVVWFTSEKVKTPLGEVTRIHVTARNKDGKNYDHGLYGKLINQLSDDEICIRFKF